MKKPKTRPPGLAAALAAHLKWEIGVLVLLVLTLLVGGMVRDALRDDPSGGVEPAAVALDDEALDRWMAVSERLALLREEGSLDLPASSLPAFVRWGSARPDELRRLLPGSDPARVLGLAEALERTRNDFRRSVEHGMVVEQLDRNAAKLGDRVAVRYPDPPAFSAAERTALEAYERRAIEVENGLYRLMPGIALPVRAWEEPAEDPAGEQAPVERKLVPWRTVNTSRHGPRVLRTR